MHCSAFSKRNKRVCRPPTTIYFRLAAETEWERVRRDASSGVDGIGQKYTLPFGVLLLIDPRALRGTDSKGPRGRESTVSCVFGAASGSQHVRPGGQIGRAVHTRRCGRDGRRGRLIRPDRPRQHWSSGETTKPDRAKRAPAENDVYSGKKRTNVSRRRTWRLLDRNRPAVSRRLSPSGHLPTGFHSARRRRRNERVQTPSELPRRRRVWTVNGGVFKNRSCDPHAARAESAPVPLAECTRVGRRPNGVFILIFCRRQPTTDNAGGTFKAKSQRARWRPQERITGGGGKS